MAGIVQLAPGGTAQAPQGAVTIKLSTTAAARLTLLGVGGEVVAPQFTVSAAEVVFVPGGAEVLVTARSEAGRPFPAGTRVGVSLRSASGMGGEVVRPAAEVGGQQSVSLVRIDRSGLLTDVLADGRRDEGGGLWARPWMRHGSYAYHVRQRRAQQGTWALVLDASASMMVEERRSGLGAAVESLVGIVATANGSAPRALLVATDPPRDAVSALDADRIDWARALGDDPAPWPRVTHAVEAAAAGADVVVLVLDEVPVDYRELTRWAADATARLVVLVAGCSRWGLGERDRPAHFWDEQLAALGELAALESVTLVSVSDLGAVVAEAAELADALYPVGQP